MIAKKEYQHSPYWYAKTYGQPQGERISLVVEYIDFCTLTTRKGEKYLYNFNPFLFTIYAMLDIGLAIKYDIDILRDPIQRDKLKRELMRDLRSLRRPFYYSRETERRRLLALERRKISRRTTSAPMPTPKQILDAWQARKSSREAMVRLGGMIHDLECYVDNCLRFDGTGKVVGRNGGIRGWLKENLPDLSTKYKTLMRYKALAIRLRQATGTKDPMPTSTILENKAQHKEIEELFSDSAPAVFSHVYCALEGMLAPETVFLDPLKLIPVKRKKKKRYMSRFREYKHR